MVVDVKALSAAIPMKATGGVGAALGHTAGGKDFATFVREAAESAIGTGKQAEKISIAGIAGKADLLDVVQAVSNAETTLSTVVAVRDKLVAAYQELMRMPV
ncbi:MAG: flagellar hook-basal body complex protein FliE [Proteobacteria bacterium]|nr:flagellar hook-basal body complex protein FliE [Pseudomonadota bacterium]MBI3497225.1 flagellar hook-basal body complex protein FliE [Pseudomonadota bacterium]